jgi:hypothetical protein
MKSVSPVSTPAGTSRLFVSSKTEQRDRLRRVARRGDRTQPHLTEVDLVTVGQAGEGVFGGRLGPEIDARAGAVAQLQVAGQEIGVQVRQHDMADGQAVLGGIGQVLLDIALRIDHDGLLRLLVGHDVRRVREALQIELLEQHEPLLPRCQEPHRQRFVEIDRLAQLVDRTCSWSVWAV